MVENIAHIGIQASKTPDRAAVIIGETGDYISFDDLNKRSIFLGQFFSAKGLCRGDHIAVLMTNTTEYFVVCWAALRTGLYITPVNWHLTSSEAAYIVQDCGAKALVVSSTLCSSGDKIFDAVPSLHLRICAGDSCAGYIDLDSIYEEASSYPPLVETNGAPMFYSSGTTGRPKGIKRELPEGPYGTVSPAELMMAKHNLFSSDTRYLSPAPLYHAASLGWCLAIQRMGGTVVIMDKFCPRNVLRFVEQYSITQAQFVPSMLVRMLNLSEDDRRRYDLSSLERVVHAAAPCSKEVKYKMIDWLGPIIHEYYSGSEGAGYCEIDSEAWLLHPGSVGRPIFGNVHIVDDQGVELSAETVGTIYFSGNGSFEYHNDAEKTASAISSSGWATFGDDGYVDQDGFVFLSDRRSDLIISGGVNIYPREVEETLAKNPLVLDAAVIGVPSDEWGQEVIAVVELKDDLESSEELCVEIIEHCRERMAHFKCPKKVIIGSVPRTPTGKLQRRKLRADYAQNSST
ncbi:MAG: AMP-binding protein [Halioglobus sp.]|nr:AMP-binding protein [Halioglobus sp.]